MLATELLHLLKNEVVAAQVKGLSHVTTDSLSKLVQQLEELAERTPDGVGVADAEIEKYKSSLVLWQAGIQRNHEADLAMLRATIETGLLALKSTLLINGGAAVAFLTFLGSSIGRLSSASAKLSLVCALEFFVWGVLVTGVGTGFAYICQAAFGGEFFGKKANVVGEVTRVVAILLTFGSFVFFVMGCMSAISAFSGGGF